MRFLGSVRSNAMPCFILLFLCFFQVVNAVPVYGTNPTSSLIKRNPEDDKIRNALQDCLRSNRQLYLRENMALFTPQVQEAFVQDYQNVRIGFAKQQGIQMNFLQLYNIVQQLERYKGLGVKVPDNVWDQVASQTNLRNRLDRMNWKRKIVSNNDENEGFKLYSAFQHSLDRSVISKLHAIIERINNEAGHHDTVTPVAQYHPQVPAAQRYPVQTGSRGHLEASTSSSESHYPPPQRVPANMAPPHAILAPQGSRGGVTLPSFQQEFGGIIRAHPISTRGQSGASHSRGPQSGGQQYPYSNTGGQRRL
ncbi:hypothetical protein C8Q75DRAFT_787340 [Abortiporus biennis]|nr:hypothetical protein C8Q75DRAFT_787340 [Abortiporus biennis]